MAKKRKASSRPHGQPEVQGVRGADARIKPIQSFEDVADSEDEFHINRDKILLEDTVGQKGRERWGEEDNILELSDDEVLAFSSHSIDGDKDDEDEGDAEDKPPPPKRARRSSNSDAESQYHEEGGFGGWGASKRDYYNADMIETEQDAAEEEAEARRLQQKRLQGMTEADFGIDENDWLGSGKVGASQNDGEDKGEEAERGAVIEVLPQLRITEDMGVEERLELLHSRYPEFGPLGKEFIGLQSQHQDLGLSAAAVEGISKHENPALSGQESGKIPGTMSSAATIKYQALTAYLGALSMYFALLTSTTDFNRGKPIAMPAGQLREHAVMESLVICRGLWEKVKDMKVPDYGGLVAANGNELAVVEESEENPPANKGCVVGRSEGRAERKQKKKMSKTLRAAQAAHAEAEAKRAQRVRKTEQGLAELDGLMRPKLQKSALKIDKGPVQAVIDDSDFGEETYLDADEAAEKARKKKSLRFYTSQITQKSNKRDQAGNDAGGDADLPYRERLRDRQARLNMEAGKRGNKNGKGDNLSIDSDSNDGQAAKDLPADNSEEYYNMVATSSLRRKSSKKALHDAQVAATRGDAAIWTEQTIGPDGKRAIGYTIEKNKGLTPKRRKDVRNPRVKKRKKYEDKVKKLSSMRQVYRGGEGRGGYKGELTGIKTGLVRSVKL